MHASAIIAYVSACFVGLLGLVAAFRSRSVPHWAFVAGALLLAGEQTFHGFQISANTPESHVLWKLRQLALESLLPLPWLLFSLTYARGNAAEFLRRWRGVLIAFATTQVLLHLVFARGLIVATTTSVGDSRVMFELGSAGVLSEAAQLVGAVLVLVNLERTFAAAAGTVRWRIKFMLMGVALIFLVRLFLASQGLLFHGLDPAWDTLNSGALLVGGILMGRSLLRAGRLTVDVYPSQSILKGSITFFLAGGYLLIVGVLAKIIAYLGGDSSFALKALLVLIVVVGLAMLLQSDRVQLKLRQFVSRHFQRPMYDYRVVWRQFTATTAAEIEPKGYGRAVVRYMVELFQTLSVSIWILDDQHARFLPLASSSLNDERAAELSPSPEQTHAIIEQLTKSPEPTDFEHIRAPWAEALRRCHPDEFGKGGTRMCIPIFVPNGRLLGLALAGDRVGGLPFTEQDRDLFRSIGAEIASGLLNLQLSERLLRARELEAFQAMATFFVHDLKNSASTINLIIRNLPDHFDDPEFRVDALRGLEKSAAHIDYLINRLGELRQELKIHTVPRDLADALHKSLSTLPPLPNLTIEREIGALPAVPLDQEQFAKVVINLVLNAAEAGARVLRISTRTEGTNVVLRFSDDGQGMTPEFLSRSLFRPFNTTKKKGLGIGMFQSKTIIESHGGRISVESAPGKGTAFTLHLPLPPAAAK